MVAISLYRGKLHRAPDVPRQWLMPTRKISLKDFKTLLNRRSKALSRLQVTANPTAANTPNSNPNPNLDGFVKELSQSEVGRPSEEDSVKEQKVSKVDGDKTVEEELVKSNDDGEAVNVNKGLKGDDIDCLVRASDALVALSAADDAKDVGVPPESASNAVVDGLQQDWKTEAPSEHQIEHLKDNALGDKEKRKKEVEEKLQILNARKHNLVQVLKQILNAEEELRRRSTMQGTAGRPLSLQVDVTNDSGSMSRLVTPRLSSEGNCTGDMEGADADDGSNQILHSRNLPRMSSMSPSSDSLHRRAPFSTVPNPSRATLGVVASSPSRFAPTGQQGNAATLPTVSVTGTNYITSSPSPAGSGGTSVFRDARLPSPWN